ncbi:MAG: HAMP domain-containing sensor histidine kinase [Caulobacterales bacterium]
MSDAETIPDGPIRRAARFLNGLAGRLLLLTFAVFLLAEVLLFAPALAAFHYNWLQDRINLAQTAALALEAAPDSVVPEPLQRELLDSAEVKRVALKRNRERLLLLEHPFDPDEETRIVTYDYTQANSAMGFGWAVESFLAPSGRVLRVLAEPRFESGEFIEIVLNEAPLKRAMARYAIAQLLFSTIVALVAGAIVYIVLSIVFVRPMRRLTNSIERFRDRPEDASIPFQRSARQDEIGRAERAAFDMAEQVRASLKQRERLAALGGAVARIAHDLRNMLATAQLVSERLSASEDPQVRQIAPRLERAIGRAAGLASSTARFGRADEEPPVLKPVRLDEAVAEAATDALIIATNVQVSIDIDPSVIAIADADHVHRLFVNLLRNAAQALGGRDGAKIVVRGLRQGNLCAIEIVDNGPGVPEAVQARLFEPFASTDSHGAGLGLAIARELARTQGGDLALARSGPDGACFLVTLPGA